VQSEIDLEGAGLPGRLSLIPALRYDRFTLDARADPLFVGPVVTLSDDALTPRLGAVWRLSEALLPYAQWSQGFRAPAPSQVNNGFSNEAAGYRSVGNPDLAPEQARSLELGLRGSAGGWRWQAAVYDNRYRDFISQELVGGRFTPADPAVFQFVNLDRARIRGAEVRLHWQIDPDWQASAAAAWAEGTRQRDGVREPLDSVDPLRVALGLQRRAGAFEWRADLLLTDGKSPARIAPADAQPFAPRRFAVLDLGVRWQPAERWTLAASLHNVADARYWRWSDVRGLPADSGVLDAFTAPGRHLQLTLRHDF
jgi:hemoglobin/transferrin/lactoferrin receptor protein